MQAKYLTPRSLLSDRLYWHGIFLFEKNYRENSLVGLISSGRGEQRTLFSASFFYYLLAISKFQFQPSLLLNKIPPGHYS